MRSEPVLSAAGVAALVSAVLALIVAFGIDVTDEQSAAILGVVGVVAPLVFALIARGRVTPVVPVPPKHEQL